MNDEYVVGFMKSAEVPLTESQRLAKEFKYKRMSTISDINAKLIKEKIDLQNQLKHRDSEISELKDFLKKMVDNSNFPGCNYTIPTEWRNRMIKIIASHQSKESCPNCLSDQVIMFNSDLNLCNNCGQTF